MSSHPIATSRSASTSPSTAAKREEKPKGKTIYICPMHPEVQQDHPGNCPKCGMTLELKTVALGQADEENAHESRHLFASHRAESDEERVSRIRGGNAGTRAVKPIGPAMHRTKEGAEEEA